MTPGITAVRMTGARHRDELPLLVLGPSLGTSASTLWTDCARGLTDVFDVVAWDLPGHGHNRAVPDEPFTMAELAAGVLTRRRRRAAPSAARTAARSSTPGTRSAARSASSCCSTRPTGSPRRRCSAPARRSATRRCGPAGSARSASPGTPVMVTGSAERWFGPGFLDRAARGRLRAAARAAARPTTTGYVPGVRRARRRSTCATGSPRSAYPSSRWPAADDVATPPELLRAIADGVRDGRYVELDGVAHLAPAEAPGGRRRAAPPALPRRGPASHATTAPSARSATPAWSYGARCSATRTSTARPRPPPTSPVTSRS